MAFEQILNLPKSEKQLVDFLKEEVQRNFQLYKDKAFFFRLQYVGDLKDRKSQITWIKDFNNELDLADFYWNTKQFRCCIMIKFQEGLYEIMCQGFSYFARFKFSPKRISHQRPPGEYDQPRDRDSEEMIDRDVFEQGFAEIAGDLEAEIRKKTM
jgi:hypothetical protein